MRKRKTKTAVVGSNGYIGSRLIKRFYVTNEENIGASHRDLNLLDIDRQLLRRWRDMGVKTAIIAAGISKVKFCEENPEISHQINVDGTIELIDALQMLDIVPVFLSSDYVFGEGGQSVHADDSPLTPNTAYGRQKAAVETALAHSNRSYLVIRMSKVFDIEKGSGTLLDEAASKLASQRPYRAAHDQTFCPTLLDDLVSGIYELVEGHARGVVNLSSPEVWSRYEIVNELADEMGLPRTLVESVSLDDLFGHGVRPQCTALLCTRLPASISFQEMSSAIRQVAYNYRLAK